MTDDKAQCPICGKVIETGAENPARPFCSRRCQLVDLGRWLDEDYRIPDDDSPPPASPEPDGH